MKGGEETLYTIFSSGLNQRQILFGAVIKAGID
jgi:hypothetical protein